MPNQVLIEPPNELKFKVSLSGQFESGFTTYMRLSNPTKDTILYKIKTTAPKKYCVRPNSGYLQPNEKVDIGITPHQTFVDANEKHKHKFMVQTIIAPEEYKNIDQAFKDASPEQVTDCKLKCVFETPGGNNFKETQDPQEANKKKVAVTYDAKTKDAENAQNDAKRINEPELIASIASKTNTKKSENTEADAQKVSSDVIQSLRDTECKLRQENLQLKEELLRLRQVGGAGDGRPVRRHSFGPEKQAQMGMMPWLVTAIGMAVLGIIIGKFIM